MTRRACPQAATGIRLTPRQREMAMLRCRDGLTNKEVARRLGLSPMTVKNTWVDIVERTEAISTSQICYALGREAEPFGVPPAIPAARAAEV